MSPIRADSLDPRTMHCSGEVMRFLVLALLPFTALAAVDPIEKEKELTEENLPRPESLGLVMVPNSQALVGGIECHAPGATAGVTSMDRIVEVEGTRIGTVEDFRRALHKARGKASIRVVIMRAGTAKRTVTIKLRPNGAS